MLVRPMWRNSLNRMWGIVNPQGLSPSSIPTKLKYAVTELPTKICYTFLKDASLLSQTGKQPTLCTSKIKSPGQPQKINTLIPPNHWPLTFPKEHLSFSKIQMGLSMVQVWHLKTLESMSHYYCSLQGTIPAHKDLSILWTFIFLITVFPWK